MVIGTLPDIENNYYKYSKGIELVSNKNNNSLKLEKNIILKDVGAFSIYNYDSYLNNRINKTTNIVLDEQHSVNILNKSDILIMNKPIKNLNKMKILITGSCGFIGFHLSLSLLKKHEIYGFDTLNDYYDKNLKISRLKILQNNKNFNFYKYDISNKKIIKKFFNKNKIDIIINLAAYAGVQYSLKNPDIYFKTNEIGFYNILENAKKHRIKKIIFASSSSVAGSNNNMYFDETQNTDSPISLYAATKKNNEILVHFYAVNYKIRIIGVRFFTVFGPFGRPDLSIFKFAYFIKNSKNSFLIIIVIF